MLYIAIFLIIVGVACMIVVGLATRFKRLTTYQSYLTAIGGSFLGIGVSVFISVSGDKQKILDERAQKRTKLVEEISNIITNDKNTHTVNVRMLDKTTAVVNALCSKGIDNIEFGDLVEAATMLGMGLPPLLTDGPSLSELKSLYFDSSEFSERRLIKELLYLRETHEKYREYTKDFLDITKNLNKELLTSANEAKFKRDKELKTHYFQQICQIPDTMISDYKNIYNHVVPRRLALCASGNALVAQDSTAMNIVSEFLADFHDFGKKKDEFTSEKLFWKNTNKIANIEFEGTHCGKYAFIEKLYTTERRFK